MRSALICLPAELALSALLGLFAPTAHSDNLRCTGAPAAPGKLALELGKSTLMRLPDAVSARSIGNPHVLQATLVASDTLYLVGAEIGSTNLIVQGRSGACSVVEVSVGLDVSPLRTSLAELLPQENGVKVTAAADAIALSGSVSDGATLAQVLDLAQAFVRRAPQPLERKDGVAPPASPPGPRLVNLLAVSAPQQVKLEVKVAEVSKTLLDKLEAGLSLRHAGGSWSAMVLADFLSGTLGSGVSISKSNGSFVRIDAERQDGQVRILAEPTVMAMSGQEGSFLAGGKVMVPVAQDNNRITLEEKEFGVGLKFTPTVLAGGRINLRVAPEVSELSRDGVGVTTGGFIGRAIFPLITTRRASTTVQLQDGQSFAIGGLIRNTTVNNVKGVPFLSEIPVLGALFRSTDFQNDRSELLFVITAHLIKPEGTGAGLDGAAAAAAQARYRKSFSEPVPDAGEKK